MGRFGQGERGSGGVSWRACCRGGRTVGQARSGRALAEGKRKTEEKKEGKRKGRKGKREKKIGKERKRKEKGFRKLGEILRKLEGRGKGILWGFPVFWVSA
jgi:hypothetical protein